MYCMYDEGSASGYILVDMFCILVRDYLDKRTTDHALGKVAMHTNRPDEARALSVSTAHITTDPSMASYRVSRHEVGQTLNLQEKQQITASFPKVGILSLSAYTHNTHDGGGETSLAADVFYEYSAHKCW